MVNLLDYTDYYGKRFAWKIGDLNAEEPYGHYPGQFTASISVDEESYAFYNLDGDFHYRSHSFAFCVWRWGVWFAVRGRPE